MQRGLLAQLPQSQRGKLLRLCLRLTPRSNAVSSIRAATKDEYQRYKLPKILSKRFAKGSADCTGEGNTREAAGSEGEVSGSGVRASLSVSSFHVSNMSSKSSLRLQNGKEEM